MIPIKLTRADINHLLAHLDRNEIDDAHCDIESSWYYGNKRNFICRHQTLKKKLKEAPDA